jgi:Ca2+-binding EF-hand superfamily protein
VKGLNLIEKGTFDEKIDFCFSIYDFRKKGYLDIFSLRELLKMTYVTVIVNLEKALKKIRAAPTLNFRGFTWDEFIGLNVLDTILDNLPIVYGNYYQSMRWSPCIV